MQGPADASCFEGNATTAGETPRINFDWTMIACKL